MRSFSEQPLGFKLYIKGLFSAALASCFLVLIWFYNSIIMACLRSEASSYRFVPLTPKGKGGHLHFALQNKVVHTHFSQIHFPNKFDKLFTHYNFARDKVFVYEELLCLLYIYTLVPYPC